MKRSENICKPEKFKICQFPVIMGLSVRLFFNKTDLSPFSIIFFSLSQGTNCILGLHQCCHSFVVYPVFSLHSTLSSPVNWLPPPVLCCGLVLGFSTPSYYECNACGCQSGDAGKGECGEDQPGGEIRSSSLLGRPVPERECHLYCVSAHCWFPPCLLPGWKALFLCSSLGRL